MSTGGRRTASATGVAHRSWRIYAVSAALVALQTGDTGPGASTTGQLMRGWIGFGGRLIVAHPHLGGFGEWRLLAQGGLAEVWEARQLSLDRLVAVKVYPAQSEEGDRRFLREAAAAGRLCDHPGIVTAHDAGLLPDDRPYLVMRLCSGGSLTPWLERGNRPSPEEVRQAGVRLAAALAAVHACGVLHRDIRPANILIDSFGNLRLADFGMATVVGAEEASAGTQAPASAYAPPESFKKQPATEAGDVYSLAATLSALLAGEPPRPAGAAADRTAGDAGSIRPAPGVEPDLTTVILTALSDDPAARPTADRLRDQLANLPAPRTAEPVPPPGPHQVVPAAARGGVRRRRGVLALGAALAAVIASVAGWQVSQPASSDVAAVVVQSPAPGGLPSTSVPSRTSGPAPTPAAGDTNGSDATEGDPLLLQDPADAASPFQTVRLTGTYRGGADILLRVQRWEEGDWLAFPIPTKTDRSGQFTAYVELGQPGRYKLRVLDPDSGVASKPSVLVIEG